MPAPIRLHPQVVKALRKRCGGSTIARVMIRAQVLLRLNEGLNVAEVAAVVGCSSATVKKVRSRYVKTGWKKAVDEPTRSGRPKAVTIEEEREIVALACTEPPDGRNRWTIRLLVKKTGYSFSTVQRVLSEDGLKPWREKNVVHSSPRPEL